MNCISLKAMACFFAILLSSSAFGQIVIATCTTSVNQSTLEVTVTCTPNYASPWANFSGVRPPPNCPKATSWNIRGNSQILATTTYLGSYVTNATIKLGSPFEFHLAGTGGVACTQSHIALYLYVYSADYTKLTINDPPPIEYCRGVNSNEVAYGFVPDVQCSFTPSTTGTYNLYFYTNIGITTHVPFVLTVIP